MSAFTIAFQVPNLVRSLFADAAIQAAFVPVFTEKLEHGDRREAFRLASNLIFVVTARPRGDHGAVHPRRAAADAAVRARLRRASRRPHRHPLAAAVPDPGPARGLAGWSSASSTATTASASSRSRRSSGTWRSSPCSSGWRPAFPEDDQIYAYAIGVLVGTVVQLAMLPLRPAQHPVRDPAGAAGAVPGRVREALRDVDVRRVLILMLPVTISLGLINFNLVDQQHRRLPRLRAGAGGDRQGVSHLHAAAGDLLGRGRDRALPDPGALRRPRRLRRPAGDDGERDAPDRAPADPGDRRDPGPRPSR